MEEQKEEIIIHYNKEDYIDWEIPKQSVNKLEQPVVIYGIIKSLAYYFSKEEKAKLNFVNNNELFSFNIFNHILENEKSFKDGLNNIDIILNKYLDNNQLIDLYHSNICEYLIQNQKNDILKKQIISYFLSKFNQNNFYNYYNNNFLLEINSENNYFNDFQKSLIKSIKKIAFLDERLDYIINNNFNIINSDDDLLKYDYQNIKNNLILTQDNIHNLFKNNQLNESSIKYISTYLKKLNNDKKKDFLNDFFEKNIHLLKDKNILNNSVNIMIMTLLINITKEYSLILKDDFIKKLAISYPFLFIDKKYYMNNDFSIEEIKKIYNNNYKNNLEYLEYLLLNKNNNEESLNIIFSKIKDNISFSFLNKYFSEPDKQKFFIDNFLSQINENNDNFLYKQDYFFRKILKYKKSLGNKDNYYQKINNFLLTQSVDTLTSFFSHNLLLLNQNFLKLSFFKEKNLYINLKESFLKNNKQEELILFYTKIKNEELILNDSVYKYFLKFFHDKENNNINVLLLNKQFIENIKKFIEDTFNLSFIDYIEQHKSAYKDELSDIVNLFNINIKVFKK